MKAMLKKRKSKKKMTRDEKIDAETHKRIQGRLRAPQNLSFCAPIMVFPVTTEGR